MTWVAAGVEPDKRCACGSALGVRFGARRAARSGACPGYRSPIDREETAAHDLQRLCALTIPSRRGWRGGIGGNRRGSGRMLAPAASHWDRSTTRFPIADYAVADSIAAHHWHGAEPRKRRASTCPVSSTADVQLHTHPIPQEKPVHGQDLISGMSETSVGGLPRVASGLPSTVSVALSINGGLVNAEVDARLTLLDFLRERARLTGTKKGCNRGECGTCTLLVDGRRVNACMILMASLEGRRVTTIEGLATSGQLHPVQEAFIDKDAFQCGFCTPGQIMSAVGCINEGHASDPAEIREWMSGNLCRCAAYPQIVAAVRAAAQAL
jgi:xanthine dehydrogenase YagT iron-sulfur-binding subunit